MEYRSLEVTVISAKDLRQATLFTKMNVYAIVSLSQDPRTMQKTYVDHNGGRNPDWNYTMNFSIHDNLANQNQSFLVFQLKCQRRFGDKDLGEVHVPVKELLDNPDDGKSAKFVTYQVRLASGSVKGELNFSYRIGETFTTPIPQATSSQPAIAYPIFPQPPQLGYQPFGGYLPPPPNAVYPPPSGGYLPPPQNDVYPPPPGGYSPPSGGYPPPQGGYPHRENHSQGGYPSGGYSPSQGGYPPKQNHSQGGYSSGGYPPSQGGYPPGENLHQGGYVPYANGHYGYYPPHGYAQYPPPPQGGYLEGGLPPQGGYAQSGYQGVYPPPPTQKQKDNRLGLGMAVLGGAVGGLLIEEVVDDVVDDVVEDAADYEAGYEAGAVDVGAIDL